MFTRHLLVSPQLAWDLDGGDTKTTYQVADLPNGKPQKIELVTSGGKGTCWQTPVQWPYASSFSKTHISRLGFLNASTEENVDRITFFDLQKQLSVQ